MENKLLHFFIKEDGNLYVTPEVPEPLPLFIWYVSNFGSVKGKIKRDRDKIKYNEALQRAKDNAVLVENKEEVLFHLRSDQHERSPHPFEVGQIYSLEGCKMEVEYKCCAYGSKVVPEDCCTFGSMTATIIFEDKKEAAQPEETHDQLWAKSYK